MNNVYSENDPDFRPTSACTLSAIFDNRTDAAAAVARLYDSGFAKESVHFMPNIDEGERAATDAEPRKVWDQLQSWLFPEGDHARYSEHLRRGGFVVSVIDVSKSQYQLARNILDDDGSIDIDERADQWRREGWNAKD